MNNKEILGEFGETEKIDIEKIEQSFMTFCDRFVWNDESPLFGDKLGNWENFKKILFED